MNFGNFRQWKDRSPETGFPTERYHQKLGKPHQPSGRTETAAELYREEEDPELLKEILSHCDDLKRPDSMEILSLFSGDNDDRNAIVAIHPGAGGTESTDWASMLFEMYKRWVSEENYQIEIMDFLPGEEAGITVTFSVSGPHAYGN